jgi:hypothetical protein
MKKIILILTSSLLIFTGCSKGSGTDEPPVTVTSPVITGQPASCEVLLSETVTLTVAATGQDLSYQWYKGGTPISGATTEKFSLKVAQLSDVGEFSCKVSNGGGSVTSNVATVELDYYLFQGTVMAALRDGKQRLRVSPLSGNETEIEFYEPTTKKCFILRWEGGNSKGNKKPVYFITSFAEGNETVAVPTSLEVTEKTADGLCRIKFVDANGKVWEGVVPLP